MEKLAVYFLVFLLLFACGQMEEAHIPQYGEVSFSEVSGMAFSGNMPNGRTEAASAWRHIFTNQAVFEIRYHQIEQTHYRPYNPNDIGEGLSYTLPYGTYSYFSEVKGGKYETHLPFKIEGEFTVSSSKTDIILNASTDYGLITVKNEFLGTLGIREEGGLLPMGVVGDGSHHYLYAQKGQVAKLEIVDGLENRLIERDVLVQSGNHYHYFLQLPENKGVTNFIELAIGPFGYLDEELLLNHNPFGSLYDPRDFQTYRTIQIGDQNWMAENLNYETEGSLCYNNDPENCNLYGRLYDWETAVTVCPEGWHLPSDGEWTILSDYLGGESIAGGKMKTTSGWRPPNTGATNESLFSALPVIGHTSDVNFLGEGDTWWSATEESNRSAYIRWVDFTFADLQRTWSVKRAEYSCRCIQD